MSKIPDLWMHALEPQREEGRMRWVGLRDTDHVLRRFGSAEVVRLDPAARAGLSVRAVADEVWALLEGEVEFRWQDLREESPSRGRRVDRRASTPTQVLAPFGVAFGVRAIGGPALLLRLCTHAEDDPAGGATKTLAWELE